jgi:site-specific DNA recombinase
MVEGLMAVWAQFDNDQKSERTVKGMQTTLGLGRWTFHAPLGYLNSGSKAEPSLKPDEERAALIRLGYGLVADGKSPVEALRQVDAAGFRTVKGRRLHLSEWHRLLRNPIYSGRIEVPSLGASHAGDFEPIVGETLFARVQRRLSGESAEPSPHVRDRADFPLRRFLRCASCAKAISGSWSTGRTATTTAVNAVASAPRARRSNNGSLNIWKRSRPLLPT